MNDLPLHYLNIFVAVTWGQPKDGRKTLVFATSDQLVPLSSYLPTSIPEMRNYTARPPDYIEENPDDPYYPDAIEKYFVRPRAYENYTYFGYYKYFKISKKRMTKKDGFRDGIQDQLGYWIYKRNKPILVQSNYRRLCDGESFFFTQLLYRYHWRSDDEIRGDVESYRARLLAHSMSRCYRDGTNENKLHG